MQDILAQVISYIVGIWRFRWAGLGVAWLVCMLGWVVVLKMPDQYQASAKVFVDTQSTLRPLLSGLAVDVNFNERLNFMTRSLLSRPSLEKVARMTDMDLQVKNAQEMEDLIDTLSKKVSVIASRGQPLYTIAYQDSDPQLAKRVVQSLLNIFVESTLGASRKDTDVAQQFLEKQIKEYEQRLISGEERLKEFKRKHVGMMPGQGGGYYQRMEALRSDLASARLEMRETEMKRDELQRQLEGEEPTFGFSGLTVAKPKKRNRRVDADKVSELSPIDQRIQALLVRQDELLVSYTERHPDVMAIEAQIKALEQQKLEDLGVESPADTASADEDGLDFFDEGAGFGGMDVADNLDANPVYQNTRMAMGEADAELASMTVRVNEYEARLKELQGMVDTLPQVEAELARLNRNYEVNKKQYDSLVARLESARISQEAEQSSDNVKFKIVEPPRVPLEPSGPNRPLFLVVVLIAGMVIGLGLSLAMALSRPIFDSQRIVESVTGVMVLGTVTMVWTPAQQWRRRMGFLAFLGTFTMLMVLFSGVMALEVLDVDLASKLSFLGELL